MYREHQCLISKILICIFNFISFFYSNLCSILHKNLVLALKVTFVATCTGAKLSSIGVTIAI
jgi:hypothetical protein